MSVLIRNKRERGVVGWEEEVFGSNEWWWGTWKLPSMSTYVYGGWKNEKDNSLLNPAKSSSSISHVCICVYTVSISVHSGLPYLTCKKREKRKTIMAAVPSTHDLTCYHIHSLSLAPLALALSIYEKSLPTSPAIPTSATTRISLLFQHHNNNSTDKNVSEMWQCELFLC